MQCRRGMSHTVEGGATQLIEETRYWRDNNSICWLCCFFRFAKEYLDKKARKALEITEMTVGNGCQEYR